MKYLFLFIFMLPSLVFCFPTNGILDDFNRGDSNPIDGIWSDSVFAANGCRLTDTTLRKSGSGTGNGCYITSTFSSNDQEVYAKLANATNHNGNTNFRLLFCLQGGVGTGNADGYAIGFKKIDAAADQLTMARVDNASYTQIGATVDREVDDNDDLGGEHLEGGALRIWFNDSGVGWDNIGSSNDVSDTYQCDNTNIGVALSNTSHWVDDVGGGNIATGSSLIGPYTILQFR